MTGLIHRIERHIQELSKFTSTPEKGVTRVVYSKEDEMAKEYLKQEMKKIALDIKEDEIGNIFATWKGRDSNLPKVWTGSHIDAPTNGGKYDGVVGVISSLEAIKILQESGFKPDCDIVIVIFVAEEPTKLGVGCLGSRALTSMISKEDFINWKDDTGNNFYNLLMNLGKNPENILEQNLERENIKTFVELHIEQGPVLEKVNIPIGIVEKISAPTEVNLTIYGEQRHAGSTPMDIRKDPVPASSEVVLAIEKLTRELSETSVGTVGEIHVTPGTSNVIAQSVEMTIDIRDVDSSSKNIIIKKLKNEIEKIVTNRELNFVWEMKVDDNPATMDKSNVEIIKECAEKLNLSYHLMYSGAYHDALIMSRKVPTNLIFIPSNKGISHAPEEFTSSYHISNGVELLSEYFKQITKF